MFVRLFKKESSTKSETVSKSLLDGYLSAKEDIQYLKCKYDDFIVRSLELEFDQYKQYVDVNFPRESDDRTHWMISEFKSDEFILNKKESNNIEIRVSYSFYEDNWELERAYVIVNSNSTILDSSRVNDIIFQYFIYWKLKQIEKQRLKEKESFQKMVDIIGKDVKRDSLIDQILS